MLTRHKRDEERIETFYFFDQGDTVLILSYESYTDDFMQQRVNRKIAEQIERAVTVMMYSIRFE
ncbi:MAG: hypothetical protein WDZ94_01650 [Patescibacteria group bacterium]